MSAPAMPINVQVSQGNGQVYLSWDLVLGCDGYKVQRSDDGGATYAVIDSPSANQFLDDTVTIGSEYWYKVAAYTGTDVSGYSDPQWSVPCQAGAMSLKEVRLRAQQRADRVNSLFVTPTEWNNYIVQSYFELYDLLVQKFGNDYFVAPALQFSLTGATLYDLPNGTNYNGAPAFYKLMGVDLSLNSPANAWMTLKKFMFIERNRYIYPQITTNLLGVAGMQYRMVGSQIEFIPTPQSGQQVRLWYIPRLEQPLAETDILDGVSGWLEYVIVDAAIKALQKEESDISALLVDKKFLIERIEAAAENRDAGQPERISETRRYGDLWGGNFSDGPIGGY